MTSPSVVFLVAFAVSGALALLALERRWAVPALVFKPLTTALLIGVVGPPTTIATRLVWAGLVASIVGDVALLRDGPIAFMVGLAFFLIAHVIYVIAFATVGTWSLFSWLGVALVAVATPLLLRVLWAGAGGLRAPVTAYALALSAMVVAAFSMMGGPVPAAALAAVGSLLFYASDASLAINRFVRPIPHAALASVGLYWLGQAGIAVAMHFQMR